MSITDKFLGMLNLNQDYSEDGYDDNGDDDGFYERDVEMPSRSPQKRKEKEIDFIDDDIEEAPKKPVRNSNMRVVKKSTSGLEVVVIKPTSFEEAREITDTLLSNRGVVLNLEGIVIVLAQRIIDFASGSTYSINGKLQKISNYIFIVTPPSVDISGDFQGILGGAFDVPSLKGNF